MPTSTLTSKGQVTIPKEIRTRLGLQVGDELDFRLDSQGHLRVVPASEPSYHRLSGLLSDYARETPVTVDEMRESIRERAAEKYGR